MKYLFVYILLFAPLAYSQSLPDYPVIGLGCGKAGMPSASIRQISDLIDTGNFDSLKTLLNSEDASLKYLSVKICEYQVKKNKLFLSPKEKDSIELAMRSDEKIEYCSGCTIRQVYTLTELFSDDTIELNKSLNYWIKRTVK